MFNFIGNKEWGRRYPWDNEIFNLEGFKDKEVIVLRSILFFHAEEKTKLSRIKLHFTDYAINKMIHDKFIEVK